MQIILWINQIFHGYKVQSDSFAVVIIKHNSDDEKQVKVLIVLEMQLQVIKVLIIDATSELM